MIFTALIVLANFISELGTAPVGFGLTAPAGVYLIGLTFTLRDSVHDLLGPIGALAVIIAAAALSWLNASPRLAAASAGSLAVSQAADQLVYSPLRRRSRLLAMAASNTVGLAVDSALFVWLAFGSAKLLAGQIVGKTWMTIIVLAAVALYRLLSQWGRP